MVELCVMTVRGVVIARTGGGVLAGQGLLVGEEQALVGSEELGL